VSGTSATYDKAAAKRKWRALKNEAATKLVTVGGLAVIGAILLIMFYLFAVVAPLFVPASITQGQVVQLPEAPAKTMYIASEEQNQVAGRFFADGSMQYVDTTNGKKIAEHKPADAIATAFTIANEPEGMIAWGYENGTMLLVKQKYRISYDENTNRIISPDLEFPLGEDPVELIESGEAITALAVTFFGDAMAAAAFSDDGVLTLTRFTVEESWTGDGYEVEFDDQFTVVRSRMEPPSYLRIDPLAEVLFVGYEDGHLDIYGVNQNGAKLQDVKLVAEGESLTDLRFLRGGISLMAASSDGTVSQWFGVRDDNGVSQLTKIRTLDIGAGEGEGANFKLMIEQRRKGFLTVSDAGNLGIYYSTSERELLNEKLIEGKPVAGNVSPRANMAMVETDDGKLHVFELHNEHPEISISSLWGKVWYESYPEPDYIWQSSAATDDFEAKFSLTPLAFGTFKAAFYAMLLALPLAISGAIYTAYFMSPSMRKIVKPMIEIMEAMPTVILGFLAGLWLAPILEDKLAGAFMLFLFVPFGIVLFGYLWEAAPKAVRLSVPAGWEPVLLCPLVVILGGAAFGLSGPVEALFFNGNMPQYLTNQLGIDYDQRNSIVVGFAMGFAVIPTIFSITEDAVFGVPKHLSTGSLALGATPWQTLVRVVLPTASPGMFSAVMIGFGRAVGETMIVLMATGNTAIMDFNIFEGMRTLSANIAVEMPESEVGSSHYRILFLAGLVLFMFTFIFNTGAEIVRQRLRDKYKTI
jgi:phosphate transport system permease protein